MRIRTTQEGDIIDTNYLVVLIGDNTYSISQNSQDQLQISKDSDILLNVLTIEPCNSAEIDFTFTLIKRGN